MRTLVSEYNRVLNEGEENTKTVSNWHKVVADAFRRCVSAGNIKRLRNLEELAWECSDVSCMGKLEFLATHTEKGKEMKYTIEYLLSRTEGVVYEVSVFENSVHLFTDVHIIGDRAGIDLQNSVIFRTQDTIRRL